MAASNVLHGGDRALPALARPKKVSTAEAVYDVLRGMIIDGQLAHGTRLREAEAAAWLGVSRTPLREAMARLIGDRLLRRTQGSVEVIDMRRELLGIRHIRMALEGYAARLAAAAIGAADLDALEATIRVSASLPSEALQERVAANTEFHSRIFRACGVTQLVQAIEAYGEYFIHEKELQNLTADQSRQALEEHRAILSALRARDGDTAEALTRTHLLSTFNQFTANTSPGRSK